jgi:hypothetical protein
MKLVDLLLRRAVAQGDSAAIVAIFTEQFPRIAALRLYERRLDVLPSHYLTRGIRLSTGGGTWLYREGQFHEIHTYEPSAIWYAPSFALGAI